MTSGRTRLAALAGAGAIACTGFALAASPATASTPASTDPTPTAAQAACDRAPWQPRVQGQPKAFHAGARSGDYLWHSTDGFHLRVTHGGSHAGRVYAGEITSGRPMRVEPVKLEGGDTVGLSANHKTIYFRFVNHGYVDGINFHTDCARTLTLSHLTVDGHALPKDRIDLGYYSQHPAHVPFTVRRYGGPS